MPIFIFYFPNIYQVPKQMRLSTKQRIKYLVVLAPAPIIKIEDVELVNTKTFKYLDV